MFCSSCSRAIFFLVLALPILAAIGCGGEPSVPASGEQSQPVSVEDQAGEAEAPTRLNSPDIDAEVTAADPDTAADLDTAEDPDAALDSDVAPDSENSADSAHQTVDSQTTNRLADETSPYLRLHMHNPVDWYPWGPEALEKAREENKCIFLSVGYSSCYWCHVMERESFMDQEIADFLNQYFVCIKVDREERPDVDAIYMIAVQILTKRGGWPMSVFLTPDAKPIYGGTYFPARDGDRPPMPGFLTVLQRVHELWTTKPDAAVESATRLTSMIQTELAGPTSIDELVLNPELVGQVKGSLVASFDEQFGGFGFDARDPNRPKFPEPSNLLFLLDQAERSPDEDSLRMLQQTLDRMAMGGIWDHVGGGFHRYSVDRFWRIPHFEKMLYDNGQLLSVYSRAYRQTENEAYRRVVDQIAEYLFREMRAEGGGFVSALDAESEHVEGKYYRWSAAELQELLGDDFGWFAELYGVDGEPNFEHDYYVLQQPKTQAELAQQLNLTDAELEQRLQPLRAKLLAARSKRERPLTDEKILCSWNGQTIRGLADAGRYCERPACVEAAAAAADFVLQNLRGDDGRLLRTHTAGEAKLNAYLDDYAFLVDGLIALHQATGDDRWLQQANELTQQQIAHFGDTERGGFYFTTADHESLIARRKQLTDGAQPAGNSVAAANLLYLAQQLDRPEYRQLAEQTIRNGISVMQSYPAAAPRMAIALAELLDLENEQP